MSRDGQVSAAGEPRTDEDPLDLGWLGDALSGSGLAEYVGCFDLFRPRRADWERHRGQSPERLRPLIDLFLLSGIVPPAALPARIRAGLGDLEALGLLREEPAGVAMAGGLAVLPVFGRWLMCHAPRANSKFYFGDDTVALLPRLTPIAGGRCLDLCAGPGMLALHAAGIADRVVAVEPAPDSAQLARLNACLNRLSHRIEVLEGDLYAPVRGERFDTVIANPPMLPVPRGFEGPTIGHGGEDGLSLTRRVLAGLPDALTPGGVAQMIGVGLSDGARPLCLAALKESAGGALDLTVSILSHRSLRKGAPHLLALVATIAATSAADEREVGAAYRAMLAQAGASSLCHLFIHARSGRGRIDVIDLSAANGDDGWRWRGLGRNV
ncbi:MAG: release factor glutamine methyltransferase [Sphingomonadales bacterium]|jgi:methylase of polypeptide subunit release factors|nr:release factor glutamine methyltransferase [Sphingomonadales bacterium]